MADCGRKVCEQCGESYDAAVSWQRWCSDECLTQWKKEHADQDKKPKRKVCEYCGEWYKPSKIAARRQRFCCEECQRQWWLENRTEAGKVYRYTCQNCGKEYETLYSNRDRFCSRECAFEHPDGAGRPATIVDKVCHSCGKAYQDSLSSDDYCSEECKERGSRRVCKVCGTIFYSQAPSTYCTEECRLEAGRQRYAEYMTEKIGDRTYICQECGKEFTAPYGDKRRRFDTDECARRFNGRIHKRTRRALKKTNGKVERINPLAVYERDGWYCGICGGKVDPRLQYPHPYSASLDHIVPLACGGEHTLSNVQLAHLACNIEKRDIGGGQLRLGLDV